MRKSFATLAIGLMLCSFIQAQSQNTLTQPIEPASPAVDPDAPAFQWVSQTCDFGNIPQGKPVQAHYEFVNSGKEPLIITDVQKTCGCTKTDWSKEPIAPGAKGFVMAEYNAEAEGAFTKAITVLSNAGTPAIKLYFKGIVVKEDEDGTPEQKTIFNNGN